MLYDDDGERAGYATSYAYSPMMQTQVGIARVRPELAELGTTVHVEQTVNHDYTTVPATVTRCPSSTPSERRPCHDRHPPLRRDRRRRRPQRPRQRRLPRQGRAEHPHPRATPPRRWRRDHRGALPRLQLHHVLVRTQPVRPEVVRELELVKHGFNPIYMPTSFAPMENGDYLLLGPDRDENIREIMRHSPRDADAMDRYEHDVARILQLMHPLFDRIPPDIFGKTAEDAADVAWLLGHLGSAQKKVIHDAVRLITGSISDFLDDYFESDIIKGYLAACSTTGTKVGPMSAGSGLVSLMMMMGEHDGHLGSWSFHKGGNGGFTQMLGRAAEAYGAEIRLESHVDHVITKEGRAIGVVLQDGTEFHADIVVSALDPRQTFTKLVDPRELPADLVESIDRFQFNGTSAKVNFALDGAPRYPALGDRTDQYRGFVSIAPSIEYLERAYDASKYGWYSERPYLDTLHPVVPRPRHGPSRQARDVVLRAVRAVPPQGQRLGHRAQQPRRHRPGHHRVVLPRLRRPGAAPRGRDAPRHRAGGRPVRGQHLRGRLPAAADVLLPARTGVEPVPHPDRGLLPVRFRHPPRRLRHGGARAAREPADPEGPRPGGIMRFLLTSAGIKNASIHDALVDLLGKPIAESSALCIPTAGYGHPQGSPGGAWRFISGREPRTPMCELGWKSLGVLELTALPSIDEERWVPWVRGDRRPAGEWRRRPVPVPLDAAVRAGGSPAVAARDGLGGAERREHGDDPPYRGGLRRVEAAHRWRQHAGHRRLLDLPAPGSRGPAGEHHGRRRKMGGRHRRVRRTRSTTKPPSKWSMAPSKSSPRGTGSCLPPDTGPKGVRLRAPNGWTALSARRRAQVLVDDQPPSVGLSTHDDRLALVDLLVRRPVEHLGVHVVGKHRDPSSRSVV